MDCFLCFCYKETVFLTMAVHTVGGHISLSGSPLWSKTTQITGGMGGAG